MMTDPIADLLTRIRNGILVKHFTVDIPLSKMKLGIVKIMKNEGFINDFEEIKDTTQGTLRIHLRYVGEKQECPIHGLQRISKPGRRLYSRHEDIPQVLGGLGISIISTNKGIMTGKEAQKTRVGGELLCSIW